MIRPFQADRLDALMSLWLTTTIEAHPFVDKSYWLESEALVRDVYLPDAETWIAEKDGALLGFISIMKRQFIGALFVTRAAQGYGVGSALIEKAKTLYPILLLEVYKENANAVGFYLKHGFNAVAEQPHPETGQTTYVMRWHATHLSKK